MLWAKVLVPLVLVTAGGTAAVVATQTSSSEAVVTADAMVWIDNPAASSTFAPGTVGVDAHAVADGSISALALYVDDERVAVDSDLTVAEDLVYATFEWKAPVGQHSLVVAQVGGGEVRSDPRTIAIAEGAPEAPEPTTTTPEPPGDTTTTGSTTTEAGETTTTGVGDTASTTTRPPTLGTTAPPTTRPPVATTRPTVPTTAVPIPTPTIDAAGLSSPSGQLTVYVRSCGYDVQVSARVRDAALVRVEVEGTNVSGTMARSGSTYTFTLRSGAFSSDSIGSRRVVVLATGGGKTVTASAGVVEVEQGCPKD